MRSKAKKDIPILELIKEPVPCQTVLLRETNIEQETERVIGYSFINRLMQVLDPLDRIEYGISAKTADDLATYICDSLEVSDLENCLGEIDSETAVELLTQIRRLSRLFFALFCASKGYLAEDYIDFELIEEVLRYNKLDITQELDILLGMHQILGFVKLPEANNVFSLKEIKKMSELLQLLKLQNNEELMKENIESVFKSTLSRIEFGQPVKKEEIFELVVQSCNSDYGAILYLLQERVEFLYDLEIVEILVNSLKEVAAGNDLRRKRAFYRGLLNILEHMDSYNLNIIFEKFIDKPDMYVPKWINFLKEVEVLEGNSVHSHEPVIDEVAHTTTEKIVPYIYLWAILAPITPTPGSEDFFKRVARTLICNIAEKAKLNFLQAFHSLALRFRQTFFNLEGSCWTSSLYYVVFHLMNEMQIDDFKKRGYHAIDLLLVHLCPLRLVSHVLPYMNNNVLPRPMVAICVQHLLSNQKLLTMLRQAGAATNKSSERTEILKQLLDSTLSSYEASSETMSVARFEFLNTTLSFLSTVFSDHVNADELEHFLTTLQKKPMQWYQLVILKYGFFKSWECDLPRLEFKAENIKCYSDLLRTSFYKPLAFWTGAFAMESFYTFYKKFLTHICPVMLSCALLEQLHVTQSIARHFAMNIYSFIQEICGLSVQVEDLDDCSEKMMESVMDCLNTTLDKICSDDFDDEDSENRENTENDNNFLSVLDSSSIPEEIRTTIESLASKKGLHYKSTKITRCEALVSQTLDRVQFLSEVPLYHESNGFADLAVNERDEPYDQMETEGDHIKKAIFFRMPFHSAEKLRGMFIGSHGSNVNRMRRNLRVDIEVPDNNRGFEVIIRSSNEADLKNAKKSIFKEINTLRTKIPTSHGNPRSRRQ